jgi:hypothetical protein
MLSRSLQEADHRQTPRPDAACISRQRRDAQAAEICRRQAPSKQPGSRGGKVDALNLVSAAANPALLLRQDDNSNTFL